MNVQKWIKILRYRGRLYDSCITMGSSNGHPWCSTYTDVDDNHINGYENECGSRCRVNDCPVGFYRNYMDNTCYLVRISYKRNITFLCFLQLMIRRI